MSCLLPRGGIDYLFFRERSVRVSAVVGGGLLRILHAFSPELKYPSVSEEAFLTKAAAVVTLKMMSLNSSNGVRSS